MTLNDIRKCCDAFEGKELNLSEDSIGLYIKTLRQLGCEISRPSRSNNYHYALGVHPFLVPLGEQHYQWLLKTKEVLVKNSDYRTILSFDRIVMRFLSYYPDLECRKKWQAEFFESTRSMDYGSCHDLISTLEIAIKEKQCVEITYSRSRLGKKPFLICPVELQYDRGALYIVAYRMIDNKRGVDQIRYRVDRIVDYHLIEGKASEHESFGHVGYGEWAVLGEGDNESASSVVVIDLLDESPFDSPPFGLGERWQWIPASHLTNEEKQSYLSMGITRVWVLCSDWFILKQQILQLDYPAVIRYPEKCVKDLANTIERMCSHYKQDGGESFSSSFFSQGDEMNQGSLREEYMSFMPYRERD